MPLDINQLAPVALWGGDSSWVESQPSPYGEGYYPYRALPLATYSALVEELRAAREEVARLRAELAGGAANLAAAIRSRLDAASRDGGV